jgi:hypothetical protein
MAGKQRTLSETLAGARVLTAAEFRDYGVLDFDCGGSARNIDLPVATVLGGQDVIVRNSSDAAETITLRLTSGGTTIATIDQNESAIVYCHGTVAPTFLAVVLKVGAT